ncbi:urease subunit beta [Deinococcus cellulosilyticus]|uniref:Urease subunit beta n=1 Tax=Deinococcus cellulosilyticus (strain DSM 18568 / NBRC 106333 / KACC 11606 / 5516J-15) TaxID=1223518 RepID=A0A511MWQ0_DEIC1|nr:urease subunit beta [Deinococcus cellulosilyticus]GEM45004.1 hypothetical protein DC3_06390 [Deinococcus cellulosilyticus NBRC 106333 = KACC 11606]
MIPGESLLQDGEIELNAGKSITTLKVSHTGDRPVQVGSHTHFFEVNRALRFDRAEAYGKRLNLPAGTAVRFEPGISTEVELIPYGGKRVVHSMNGLVAGPLDEKQTEALVMLEEWQ